MDFEIKEHFVASSYMYIVIMFQENGEKSNSTEVGEAVVCGSCYGAGALFNKILKIFLKFCASTKFSISN